MTKVATFLAGALLLAACGSKADEAAAPTGPAVAAEAAGAVETASVVAESAVAPVQIADEAPAAQDGGPPVWSVDRANSSLTFAGVQTGKSFEGSFGDFEASIAFDPANLAESKVTVVVATASAKTGDRQRDDAMPGADWFSAKAYPKAIFESSEIVSTGVDAYEARGKLTIRGVSQDVALPFSLSISGERAVADGAVTLVRTDFGVGQGEFATGQWVGLEVTVAFHIEADR